MTRIMTPLLLPLLTAMVAAAPLAETKSGEQAVDMKGDRHTVDRAKRAKEEIVFGNQQNRARMGPSKKSIGLPLFLSQQAPQPPIFPQQGEGELDKTGYMFAEKQQALPPQESEETLDQEKEKGATDVFNPVPIEGGLEKDGWAEKETNQVALIPVAEEGSESTPKVDKEMAAKEKAEQASVESPEVSDTPASAVQPEEKPKVEDHVMSSLPLNSQSADAEEALQAKDDTEKVDNADDAESLLKELHDDNDQVSDNGSVEGAATEDVDELSAEAELKQVTNRSQEKEMSELNTDSKDYAQNLLKYILLHGDEYERLPVNYGYPYPTSYYLQRRRRSLARRRLPHIHRRKSGTQLARSKRTKRDLFDDDLYYDQEGQPLNEDPEELARQADVEELIAFLKARYPALYDTEEPARASAIPYPWPVWYPGDVYQQEPEPEYYDWEEEEEPDYVQVPMGWAPSQPQAPAPLPAWEPAFYPEEVDEPNYYPAPAKRQMLSMVPGNRRKRFFFPFAREPYTHWGAFVPAQEKRDYDDAYRRLKELAMVMAESRQPASYFDSFDDYKRK